MGKRGFAMHPFKAIAPLLHTCHEEFQFRNLYILLLSVRMRMIFPASPIISLPYIAINLLENSFTQHSTSPNVLLHVLPPPFLLTYLHNIHAKKKPTQTPPYTHSLT